MSATKNYFENLAILASDALASEFVYYFSTEKELTDEERFDVYCEVSDMIFANKIDSVFGRLLDRWTDCHCGSELEEAPKTFAAMCVLLPHVSKEYLEYVEMPNCTPYTLLHLI